jgi:hypothetical protein
VGEEEPRVNESVRLNWGAVLLPWLWSLAHGVWPWFWAFSLLHVAVRLVGSVLSACLPANVRLMSLAWFAVLAGQQLLSVRLGWIADQEVLARDQRRRDSGRPLSLTRPESWESYLRGRKTWAAWGVVIAAVSLGVGLFNTASEQPYRLPVTAAAACATVLVLGGAWVASRREGARLPRLGSGSAGPGPTIWAVLACAAVVAAALLAMHGSPAPTLDPGSGTTIADDVYRAIRPVQGEQVDLPNPTDYPLDKDPPDFRLADAVERNPLWKYSDSWDDDEGSRRSYYFGDGSSLTFVVSPRPGPHEPPPGDDTGTKLDRVEITRP